MKIGKTIWKIRKKLGMTQVQFSEKMGITQTYLSSVENGKKTMSDDMLNKIGKKLGVTGEVIRMMSLEAKDVPENKRDAFMMIKDQVRSLAEEVIFNTTKQKDD